VSVSFQPKNRGKIIDDSVQLFISGGNVFHGWKSVSITKDIESMADSFSLTLDDSFQGKGFTISPFTSCEIKIGQETILRGFIDSLEPSFGKGTRSITVQGRSKAGDLIDCNWEGQSQFSDLELIEFAKILTGPFFIQVFSNVNSDKIGKFSIRQDEKIFEILNRAAKLQGFFWVSTPQGNIRLTRANRRRAVSQLQQGVNLISGNVRFDVSQRFSRAVVRGQAPASIGILGAVSAQAEGIAFDRGVPRYRPLVIIAESSVDSKKAEKRAQWELANSIAEGMLITVGVQGWRQQDGSLWEVNQVTRLAAPFLGLNEDVLIKTLTFEISNNGGTTTSMTLVRPDSFDPKPVIEKNKDPLSVLGF